MSCSGTTVWLSRWPPRSTSTGRLRKRYPRRSARLHRWNSGKAATYEMIVRRAALSTAGVRFDEEFGAGAEKYLGDEYILIADALRRGLRCRFFPHVVAVHPRTSSGSGFGTARDAAARAAVFERVFGPGRTRRPARVPDPRPAPLRLRPRGRRLRQREAGPGSARVAVPQPVTPRAGRARARQPCDARSAWPSAASPRPAPPPGGGAPQVPQGCSRGGRRAPAEEETRTPAQVHAGQDRGQQGLRPPGEPAALAEGRDEHTEHVHHRSEPAAPEQRAAWPRCSRPRRRPREDGAGHHRRSQVPGRGGVGVLADDLAAPAAGVEELADQFGHDDRGR